MIYCENKNKCIHLQCSPKKGCRHFIIDESVLAFILDTKSGKFHLSQGWQHTHHLVFGVYGIAIAIYLPIRVWGLFICDKGNSRASCQID